MAFENQAGVRLSPFHLNPNLSGEILQAVLGALQEQRLRKQQQIDVEQQGANRTLDVAKLLAVTGAGSQIPGVLNAGGVTLPAGTTVPESDLERRSHFLSTLPPETASLLDKTSLFGPIAALHPDQMQQAFEQAAGVKMTPFEQEQVALRKQANEIELKRLDVERSRATTESQRAALDSRTLQLQIGNLLAGSVPGIDPISGQRVSVEDFNSSIDKMSELMSKGVPVPGNLWAKVLPVDRAAALAKQASAVDPAVEVETKLLTALNAVKDPGADQVAFMQKLVTDIWQRVQKQQPQQPTQEGASRSTLTDKLVSYFEAAMDTKLGKKLKDFISSNATGILSVTGTQQLRPINSPEGMKIPDANRTEILDAVDTLRKSNPPDELVRSIEAELVKQASSGNEKAFQDALAKVRKKAEERLGGTRPTP